MPTAQDIEMLMKDQRFQSLQPQEQVRVAGEALRQTYGERFTGLEPMAQGKAIEAAINEFKPQSWTEWGLSQIPVIGPVVEQFAYQRPVRPSELTRKYISMAEDPQYGSLFKGLEQAAVMGGTALAIAGATAAAGVAGLGGLAAWIGGSEVLSVPSFLAREAVVGTIFEAGNFIFEPPRSGEDAALRLGFGAAGNAALGGAFRGVGELVGKFREAGNMRKLARDFGGREQAEDFLNRLQSGNPESVSFDELEVFARRTQDKGDLNLVKVITEAKTQNRQRIQGEVEALNEELRINRETELVREQDLNYKEQATLRDLSTQQRLQEELVTRRNIEEIQRDLDAGGIRRAQAEKELNLRTAQERSDVYRRDLNNEIARQREVDLAIKENRVPYDRPLTKSEDMLLTASRDVNEAQGGFVGREPVTLPMAMIREIGGGEVEGVVVDRFNSGQGILRYGKGIVPRTQLRGPRSQVEEEILSEIRKRENINPVPSRDQALEILRQRVEGERNVRLADSHRLRPDFETNNDIHTQEFNLRKRAAERFLEASNKQFGDRVTEEFAGLGVLRGGKIISSLEGISLNEANDVGMALKGAGFENVRMAISPEGTVDISITRGQSEKENYVAELYNKYVSKHRTFDPIERTYSGLQRDEHESLGRAFGLSEKQIERYNQFVEDTMRDIISRGIRVPVNTEVLKVPPIEEQVLKRQARALSVAPEAVVNAERMQRFEVGDSLRLQDKLYQVFGEVRNPKTGERGLLLESLDKNTLGMQLPPMNEDMIRQQGGVREITRPIGPEPGWQGGVARSLEAMLNPNTISPMPPAVEPTVGGIQQAARELGLRVNRDSRGNYTFTQNGIKFQFENPGDAARFLDGLRMLKVDKDRISRMAGGPECL